MAFVGVSSDESGPLKLPCKILSTTWCLRQTLLSNPLSVARQDIRLNAQLGFQGVSLIENGQYWSACQVALSDFI